jgi:two-component system sensor histidine kinase KdpD
MDDTRPDPDTLLRRVQREERRVQPGRLKVFFGAAPGVGKSYAMLEAARLAQAAGVDVVVGWLEPHGRAETEALAEGLERLPAHELQHSGVSLREFDTDAALARRPGLLLLDELAHTNAPGSRHPKRWQDAVELIEAGIDVWNDAERPAPGERQRPRAPPRGCAAPS